MGTGDGHSLDAADGSLVDVVFVSNSGEVGLGTLSPDEKLDVVGNINATGSFMIGCRRTLYVPGDQSLMVGLSACGSRSVSGTTALGDSAGYSCTAATNTFVGSAAGRFNTTGYDNVFVGDHAGYDNVNGLANTFVGFEAGKANKSGGGNTFVGSQPGPTNVNGQHNTYVGNAAGSSNASGPFNVFIGNLAGIQETGSNKLHIANGMYREGCLFYGDFETGCIGLGTLDPQRKLHIVGDNPRILIEAESVAPEINFMNAGEASNDIWSIYKHGTADDLRFYQGGDKVTIEGGTGNVGIGTTNPRTCKLYVSGA